MFEWLKDIVSSGSHPAPKKQAAKPAKKTAEPPSSNTIQVDSRSYPLLDLNHKAVIAGNFDGSLTLNQAAKITVNVNDQCGRFSFTSNVIIDVIKDNGQFRGVWELLEPRVEKVLKQYASNKQAQSRARK